MGLTGRKPSRFRTRRFFSSARNFGQRPVIAQKRNMARPTYQPTVLTRRKVSIAAGAGMSHEEIALALGISRNTLEKHFEKELSIGAYERRLEVLSAMHKAAKGGNVAAQKAYMQLTPRPAAPPPEKPASKPLGKKEQAQADAASAQVGTEWGNLLKPAATLQ